MIGCEHRAVLAGTDRTGLQCGPVPSIATLSGCASGTRIGRIAHQRCLAISRKQRVARRIRELSRLVAELAHVERFVEETASVEAEVAVQQPLETERVEVFLRDLHEARLNLDQAGRDVKVFQNLLKDSELLSRIGDTQLADGGEVGDRGAVRPLHAQLLEEDLPVLLLTHVRRLHKGCIAAAALRPHLADRSRYAVSQRREHVVRAGHQFGVRFVGRHDHHDVAADLELHAGHVADQLESVIETDKTGTQRRDGRCPARCRSGRDRREGIRIFRGRSSGGRGGAQLEHEVHAALLERNFGLVEIPAGLLKEVHRIDNGGGRTESDFRNDDIAQLLLDNLLGRLGAQWIDGRLFAREIAAPLGALCTIDGVALRRP